MVDTIGACNFFYMIGGAGGYVCKGDIHTDGRQDHFAKLEVSLGAYQLAASC